MSVNRFRQVNRNLFFELNHKQSAGGDQQAADDYFEGNRFVQEKDCHNNRQDKTEFVYGYDLRGLSKLQGLKIAQPGGAGRQAGSD